MDFKTWITQKYIDWRGDAIGNERSITDFSEFLGIKKTTLSNWMNSGNLPQKEQLINRLVDKYGEEVYVILGRKSPDPLSSVPSGPREQLRAALAEMDAIFIERNIAVDSPEGEAIAAEVFTRHGIIVKSTTTNG